VTADIVAVDMSELREAAARLDAAKSNLAEIMFGARWNYLKAVILRSELEDREREFITAAQRLIAASGPAS